MKRTLAALGASLALLSFSPALARGGPSCGEVTFHGRDGIVYDVLFAKNGAVQRYQLVSSSNNPERDHDAASLLIRRYGPEGIDAPPLRILSFKPGGSGGMMVPDKAIDSCGRISHFH